MAHIPPRQRWAAAIASAALGTDWSTAALRDRLLGLVAAAAASSEPDTGPDREEQPGLADRLVRQIVSSVQVTFPRAPTASASILIDHLEALEPVGRLQTLLRPPPLEPVPATMLTNRWRLARLDSEQDLADLLELSVPRLLWLADPQHRLSRTRPGPLHPYDRVWLRRSGRAPRLLEGPTPILKRAQRTLLEKVVGRVPVHGCAHGFVPGRSVLTHATPHVGAALVLSLDLRSFFASVSGPRVRGVFRTAGYPEPVAALLTGLTTTRTPTYALRRMPAGGSVEDRYRLRALLRGSHLAQGAPTSPALANAVAYRLDLRLHAYAARCGLAYSRYADDLAFSGAHSRESRAGASRLVAGIAGVVAEEGFALNPGKTRVMGRAGQQRLTGVVVNERPNVTRAEHDRLRAVLHDAVRHGPDAANREDHPDFRRHLEGRVAWVSALNPDRGGRLAALLRQVTWE